MFTIRSVTLDDAPAIAAIYAHYTEKTAVSFEYEAPSIQEMERRIASLLGTYPYYVAELDDRVIGYAYAHPFVGREAYRFSAEMTVYLDKSAKRNGIGRALYLALEQDLKAMGITNLYACIGTTTIPDEYLNHDSETFHAKMGYRTVGRFDKCGYKFGRWYDMIWMEKIIGEHKG